MRKIRWLLTQVSSDAQLEVPDDYEPILQEPPTPPEEAASSIAHNTRAQAAAKAQPAVDEALKEIVDYQALWREKCVEVEQQMPYLFDGSKGPLWSLCRLQRNELRRLTNSVYYLRWLLKQRMPPVPLSKEDFGEWLREAIEISKSLPEPYVRPSDQSLDRLTAEILTQTDEGRQVSFNSMLLDGKPEDGCQWVSGSLEISLEAPAESSLEDNIKASDYNPVIESLARNKTDGSLMPGDLPEWDPVQGRRISYQFIDPNSSLGEFLEPNGYFKEKYRKNLQPDRQDETPSKRMKTEVPSRTRGAHGRFVKTDEDDISEMPAELDQRADVTSTDNTKPQQIVTSPENSTRQEPTSKQDTDPKVKRSRPKAAPRKNDPPLKESPYNTRSQSTTPIRASPEPAPPPVEPEISAPIR
ncbi:MAG: hypothetical protein KVP17_001430 [Porospora cf. gigantea B]|uniref:uncharacterized protein n=1 Tax=Porospora cf. gigantea B TaxID=2853592 RepID=UPI003571EF49|nr:MAG: hypothetical protein KVP17_001430 [Porospora cf. gigantea B]